MADPVIQIAIGTAQSPLSGWAKNI